MSIKISLALALSLALQLPTVWAEESKPADPPKAEAVKPAEAAKPADTKGDAPKTESAEVNKAIEEAQRQEVLMGKFQTMLQEGMKAENPTLKAATQKLAKIMDNPKPPTLDDLNAALAEFKTAKGTLSPEEGTLLEDISKLLRGILMQIAAHAENQEKPTPDAAMDADEEDADEDEADKTKPAESGKK
jgi:hypothetical protein